MALQRVHLHHIDLDVLHEGVLVQVIRELLHKVMEVANVDQRAGIRQLGFLQEVLHFHWVVVGALTADALHLLHVAASAGSLDVLEMNIRIGAGVQNRTEEIEDALVRAEAFEHLYNLHGPNLLVVLDGHLHGHLQVLPVVAHEVVEALQGRLWGELREVLDEELWRHLVRMHHDALHVGAVAVMLHGPLHQPSLLTELANVGLVVMGEHVHLQDGLSHLGRLLEVHGQQLRLQGCLVRPVGLQSIQQDRSRLLQAVLVHEDLHNLVDVDERRAILALEKVFCKVGGALRVCGDHVGEQLGIVSLVAHPFHIRHNLVELALLNEAGDHLLV
mmetsp:Transcript_30631/g.49135  ORF Transcript_30631/g.49135 Transcript_30631/m.49135 type:complete len:331 (+) Transcript_30631:1972-2964(+)